MYEVAIVFFFLKKEAVRQRESDVLMLLTNSGFFCVLEDKLRVFVFRDSSLIRLTAGKTMPNTYCIAR